MTPPGARVSSPRGPAPGGPAWAWWTFIILCSAGIVVILATHATGRAAVGCWDRAAVYHNRAQVCVDSCSPPQLRAPNPCPRSPSAR